MKKIQNGKVAVIGSGFTGLSAAYELTKHGIPVTLYEKEEFLGGLAGAFETNGERLDKFYHHWFTTDHHIMEMISELGLSDRVITNTTTTGMYYANKNYRLSSPVDLLKFKALPLFSRIRLGLLTLYVRRIKNWRRLENFTAQEWLTRIGGRKVFEVVWGPLLKGKFGKYSTEIGAVWFWNKIKLRGSSRNSGGQEQLGYFQGSFAALAESIGEKIIAAGGIIKTNTPVHAIRPNGSDSWSLIHNDIEHQYSHIIVTTPLPTIANMIKEWADQKIISKLQRINYLANVCLVLRLKKSLSSTYWLNVNDASFPFVGIIEHTNFHGEENYEQEHVVYLSKYLSHDEPLFTMNDEQILAYSVPYIQKMFPDFSVEWINNFHVWKARWAQPVVERKYSELTPETNLIDKQIHICSMAQIYPEDRGTNYAVREGQAIAQAVIQQLT